MAALSEERNLELTSDFASHKPSILECQVMEVTALDWHTFFKGQGKSQTLAYSR